MFSLLPIFSQCLVVYSKAPNFHTKHVLHKNRCKICGKIFIVYISAASSVHPAIDVLNLEQQSKYKDKVYAIPGLSPNPYAKNPRKIVQNLVSEDLKVKIEIVAWHDVLNNSICKRKSKNDRPLSVPDLTNVLKTLQNKLSTFVHCQSDRTPDIFDSLKELEKANLFKCSAL